MKPAISSTMFGLVLCGCGAFPRSNASMSTSPGGDDLYFPGPSAAAPGQDLAVPASPGSVRTVDEPWRSIEGAPSGRVRLLEMYQAAVSQRDRSAQRAADLERELEAALARAAEAEKARADLETRNVGLSSELREIHAKALELARRLARSELSLLEAERTGLEVRTSRAAGSRSQ